MPRVVVTAVVLALLFSGCSPVTAAESQNLPSLKLSQPDCRLVQRTISAQEDGLFLRCATKLFRVYHPKNLYGFVSLHDANDALTFLRFFSSRRTFFLVDAGGIVEVADASTCGARCASGDFYSIRPELYTRALAAPTITMSEDSLEGRVFMVTRHVVALDQHIYRIVERVTERGDYSKTESTIVVPDASEIGIVHVGEH